MAVFLWCTFHDDYIAKVLIIMSCAMSFIYIIRNGSTHEGEGAYVTTLVTPKMIDTSFSDTLYAYMEENVHHLFSVHIS